MSVIPMNDGMSITNRFFVFITNLGRTTWVYQYEDPQIGGSLFFGTLWNASLCAIGGTVLSAILSMLYSFFRQCLISNYVYSIASNTIKSTSFLPKYIILSVRLLLQVRIFLNHRKDVVP